MRDLFKCDFFVEGMHCAACELLIEKKLSRVEGIKHIDAKLNEGKIYIESNRAITSEELSILVRQEGYKIVEKKEIVNRDNKKDLFLGFIIAVAFSGMFVLFQKAGVVNLASSSDQITFPFIFLIGVIASLSTCMAVVGGLVLSLSTNYAKEDQIKPMIAFHISRIISFFILGGVIGLLGSTFILTPLLSFILNLVLFLAMIIMAINLLEILPVTKVLQLRIPKFIGKEILNITETNHTLTPILLGAATFFLPCGFTQSMQLFSLTTGSFFIGAITMLVFALGTLPMLALISIASMSFSKGLKSGVFFKAAAFIIIFFALFNFIAALVAIGLIPPLFNI